MDEIDRLILQLNDHNPNSDWSAYNRRKAAEKLGNTGDTRAVGPLIDALKDEDCAVRESAVIALGMIKDAESVPALIEILKNEGLIFQWQSAWALGEIQDTRALPALFEKLRNKDLGVRSYVAEALAKIAEKAEIDLEKVKQTLIDYVNSKESKERETARREASSAYATIAAGIAKRKQAEMGGELLKEKPKPPKGRMYRKLRKAMA